MTVHEQTLTSSELLDRLATAVAGTDDTESLVRPLLELLQLITGLDSTFLTSIDPDRRHLHVIYTRNAKAMEIPEGLSLPWGDSLCKRALDEERPYTDNVPERWGEADISRKLGITTYLSVPVRAGDNELYGTLCGASVGRVAVSEQSMRMLSLFATLIARQIERDHLLARLRMENLAFSQYAMTDPLTGIPNRRALLVELERSLANTERSGQRLHVSFIDLDGFKGINDHYGHDAGDRFLISLAAAMTDGLRSGDFLARIGGDEFIFLGEAGNQTVEESEQVLQQRLTRLTSGSFDIGGATVDYAGASVGVVTARAGEKDVEALLKRADNAMYAVKQARREGE